jgi:hypothetical protein
MLGLVGLGFLSMEWLPGFLEARHRKHLYAAEGLIKSFAQRGARTQLEDADKWILPFPLSLESYDAAAVMSSVERTALSDAERRLLSAEVRKARPWLERLRAVCSRKARSTNLKDLVAETIGRLLSLRVEVAVTRERKFWPSILGTAFTAAAIVLPLFSSIVSDREQNLDRATIAQLAGKVLDEEQTTRLEHVLAATPSAVDIVFAPVVGEGYAKQLKDVFETSGWAVTIEASIFSSPGVDAPVVFLNVGDKAEAQEIAAGLESAGASYSVLNDVGPTKVQEVSLKLPHTGRKEQNIIVSIC